MAVKQQMIRPVVLLHDFIHRSAARRLTVTVLTAYQCPFKQLTHPDGRRAIPGDAPRTQRTKNRVHVNIHWTRWMRFYLRN
ncbi:unnamed protein product [Arctogadus glacialis]